MNFNEAPDILTVDEVRKLLRCSKQVIYEEVHAGRLPVIRVGERVWRFSKVAVQRWLEAQGA